MTSRETPLTPIADELRLRCWARRYYVPLAERHPSWHPIFLDEMSQMDDERAAEASLLNRNYSLVPLEPGDFLREDPRHTALAAPKLLMTIARVGSSRFGAEV